MPKLIINGTTYGLRAKRVRAKRVKSKHLTFFGQLQGERREAIFFDDADRMEFLRPLGQACQKTELRVHAYCLLRNHFHVVLQTSSPNLDVRLSSLSGPAIPESTSA
jgi:putative transposase